MIRRPPRSTLFPTRRSSDLAHDSYALLEQGRLVEVIAADHLAKVGGVGESDRHDAIAGASRAGELEALGRDRKSTRLNSSHSQISYAVFCLKKKTAPTPVRLRSPRLNIKSVIALLNTLLLPTATDRCLAYAIRSSALCLSPPTSRTL